MHTRTWLPGLLRFDALLNWAGALVAVAAAGPVAEALGLTVRWPLYALAVVFLVNGALVWRAAAEPRPGLLMALAEVDFLFVAGVLAAALFALPEAETWARVALVVIAAATTLTGAAKLLGRTPAGAATAR